MQFYLSGTFQRHQPQLLARLSAASEDWLILSRRGISIPAAAVALGARVIEKHITLDKSLEGNDHKVSLLPHEFKRMIEDIRNVEAASSYTVFAASPKEKSLTEKFLKSLVATKDIQSGETITKGHITVKALEKGSNQYTNELIGLKSIRKIKNMTSSTSQICARCITRLKILLFPVIGTSVRFHDCAELLKNSDPDLLEFHLSFQDFELQFATFFKEIRSKLGRSLRNF